MGLHESSEESGTATLCPLSLKVNYKCLTKVMNIGQIFLTIIQKLTR